MTTARQITNEFIRVIFQYLQHRVAFAYHMMENKYIIINQCSQISTFTTTIGLDKEILESKTEIRPKHSKYSSRRKIQYSTLCRPLFKEHQNLLEKQVRQYVCYFEIWIVTRDRAIYKRQHVFMGWNRKLAEQLTFVTLRKETQVYYYTHVDIIKETFN